MHFMGVKKIVSEMEDIFSVKNMKRKHYRGISLLLDKLKQKEETIRNKFENERDENKRKKQKRSLLVIQAQQKKAEKLLNA